MAIAVDNSAISQNNGATASLSFNHTITSNTNGVLIVFVSNWASTSSPSATSVKWGTTSLTRYGGAISTAGDRCDMWYLLAPSTGTQSVAITFAASQEISGCSVSLTGVDQTTPFGTLASQVTSGPQTSPTTTFSITSSASTDLILAAVSLDTVGAGTFSAGGGFTMLQQDGGTTPDTQGTGTSDHAGTGANVSTSFSWSLTTNSNTYAQIGVAAHVASAGGGPTNYHLLTLGGVGS